MRSMQRRLGIQETSAWYLYWAIAGVVLLSILGSIIADSVFVLVAPAAFLLLLQTIFDYKKIHLLLFACVPISTEINVTGSLALYLPTEPLMAGFLVLYGILILYDPKRIATPFMRHPLTLLLLAHLGWMLFTTLLAEDMLISAKFSLAKLWYVVPFFFLVGELHKTEAQLRKLLWGVIIVLLLATIKVFIHHYTLDFGFNAINEACYPTFRNHVDYAALLTLVTPFVWYLRKAQAKGSWARIFLNATFLFFILAIFLSYTRAAYLTLFMTVGVYFVVRWRLTKLALLAGTLGLSAIIYHLVDDNTYLEYAPTERTIAHREIGAIVEATYQLEDVSTMERYYRWIAGARMSQERLATGFGPGNFYSNYKGYTLNRFQTYVSDNPEKSGVHSYYLMMLIEQGIPGMLLFIVLVFYTLILGERVFHATKVKARRELVMAFMMALAVIDAFALINDMLEMDKIGAFFFLGMAVFIRFDLTNKKEAREAQT